MDNLQALKARWPENIGLQCFEPSYYQGLEPSLQKRLLKCLQSGLENPDSQMGCYASHPDDYEQLQPFFARAIARYHGVAENARQHSNWDLTRVTGVPADGQLDLASLGVPPLSLRVRTGRNLRRYNLPSAMHREERIQLEQHLCSAFDTLRMMPSFAGQYFSLTPGSAHCIDDATYHSLVDQHLMFKNMADDPYLAAAGIADDWPHGRGCYISDNRNFIIWVGEEDHLRIICMDTGTELNAVFEPLRTLLDVLEAGDDVEFAFSPTYGVVTSCPTNIGTALRASAHLPLPKLTADGTDRRVKQLARSLGLSVRGIGGEHTPIGSDGTVDISPSARFHVTEADILARLYFGIAALWEQEQVA